MAGDINTQLDGKTAVVTGASSGLGLEIARGLAAGGASVILACRDLGRGRAAADSIRAGLPGAALAVELLDLASLASVRSFAQRLVTERPRLDILVNNAGGWSQQPERSRDGIELIWATNVLGPHLLTRLLLPTLQAGGAGRIVNLSSTVAGGLDLGDPEYKTRPFDGFKAYSQSKQANRMLTWSLAARLAGRGATANAMSPGLVKTNLNRNIRGPLKLVFSVVVPLFGKSPAKGADTALWLASDPSLQGVNGKFFEDRKEKPCQFQADTQALAKLEQVCDSQVGLAPLA
jgi:NAD(P)-dependent dehydrogenase (short-subunit alcohol dehydrogenase family)